MFLEEGQPLIYFKVLRMSGLCSIRDGLGAVGNKLLMEVKAEKYVWDVSKYI